MIFDFWEDLINNKVALITIKLTIRYLYNLYYSNFREKLERNV